MISVTILTKNSCKHLRAVLQALQSFDEVLLYDTGSEDDTLTIATFFPNVTIHCGRFLGFGKTHNAASALAKHDWIFSIDSDEIATAPLIDEVLTTKLDPSCVYSVPRENLFNGKI